MDRAFARRGLGIVTHLEGSGPPATVLGATAETREPEKADFLAPKATGALTAAMFMVTAAIVLWSVRWTLTRACV